MRVGGSLLGLLFFLIAFATPAAPAAAQTLSGWDSVWQDEFNGSMIDYSRWEVAYRRDSPNNEQQHYLPDQVSVGNGQLTITATNEGFDGKPYRSGLVRTWQEHRYGRWEVRADLPFGQGMWPAIWLLPRDLGAAPWPTGGEIDIMENVGNDTFFVKGSYHYNWTPGTPITSNNDYITGEDFAAGMHDYAVEWDPDQLRFYVDNNLYHVVDNPIQPVEQPMSLIINLAVGGDWPGWPDGSTQWPQTFDIDYARYWTRDEGELINPDFDRSGWGLNGWDVFGDEIGNVSAQSEAVLDGTHSLKLFGQFNGGENFSGAFQGIAVEGGEYVTADASTFVLGTDSIAGTANELIMKIEYYSSFDAAYGSPEFLGEVAEVIADGSSGENAWASHQLAGVAPAGAVEARVAFVFRQPGEEGGAVHVDAVSLTAGDFVLPGDADGDGDVDGDDLIAVQTQFGATGATPLLGDADNDGDVDGDDLIAVQTNFGNVASVAVPEPGAAVLLLMAGVGLIAKRRVG